MMLNITRSNVLYTYGTSVHESQILGHFALRPAVFALQVILRKCAELPQYNTKQYKVKGISHVVLVP